MSNYVVIGSNSFSGSNFVNHLLKNGEDVIGMSRSQEPDSVFLPYKWHDDSSFRFEQVDLNHDLDHMMDQINDEKPDYIVNFAAQGMVAQSWDTPLDWFQTNTLSNVLFHDELRKCDFLKKYVHISTPEVYGTCEGLVKESFNYCPSTPYAVSRAAADLSLMSFYKAYDFPVVFTRAANVFGSGQQLYRIIPRTILAVLLGEKLQLHGGGHSVRSFIHIDDVARGTQMIAEESVTGEVYHLSTTKNISIRDLVTMIIERMGADFSECVEIAEERLGKDKAYLLDSSKARDLGWADKISLEQGIDETIAWVKSNIEVLKGQPLGYVHKK